MYRFFVSVLFLFIKDPETAHKLALFFLKIVGLFPFSQLTAFVAKTQKLELQQRVFGVNFPNPVGLAAGLDKDGGSAKGLESLGFGFLELGTVTKYPQDGNPRQRIFRFDSDRALVNRMGFNNKGAGALSRRLAHLKMNIPVGISIGKSKRTELEDAAADYRFSLERLYDHGDYFAINVSSPNTPGLRELQDKKFLVEIVSMMNEFRDAQKVRKPLLVKIAPDLSYEAIDEVLKVCEDGKIDGIIAVNTTVARLGVSRAATETAGGLSGEPIKKRATEIISYIHSKKPNMPIIGVGGIFTAEDAYEKIKAGASLLQVYTGFIYEGPLIARAINEGLAVFLKRDGYKSISEAVGKNKSS
ncbi:quinone-dependent dihydroorotate dehydrogenase [Patescibacteria group bacterium]|nr:quinone-dependent dihydroorotate dehydrogenase [Patescibacteria group bacterium]